jgi:hypothetical protein
MIYGWSPTCPPHGLDQLPRKLSPTWPMVTLLLVRYLDRIILTPSQRCPSLQNPQRPSRGPHQGTGPSAKT